MCMRTSNIRKCLLALLCCLSLTACTDTEVNNFIDSISTESDSEVEQETSSPSIPNYSGTASVSINNNKPFFTNDELTTISFERYSDLDDKGRCGVATACVGRDIMPTEDRGPIGKVKPTGWHTVKYDCISGKYLYNRCHLIGYQLTGENANERNIITGTRYLNVEGMLGYEDDIAEYVKLTNNHVMYRVTPMFTNGNLVADGVLLEAESVEDKGKGLQFCVYCYNVQPGVDINYATGDSKLTK